jgi:hypothetical protein
LSGNVSRSRTANFVSASSYFRSFSAVRFFLATCASVSFGRISIVPPRYCTSSRVSVARAAPCAHFKSRGYSFCTTSAFGCRT